MLWQTHVLAGISSLWLLQLMSGGISIDLLTPLIITASVGALLPDLDAAESKIKHLSLARVKPLVPLSSALHGTLGHRSLLHSLLGLGIAAFISSPLLIWWDWQLSLALVLGYASHLLTDAATKSGIPLLYPKKKRYHLLPRRWRITTGSLAEEVVFTLFAVAVLFLLFSYPPFAGASNF